MACFFDKIPSHDKDKSWPSSQFNTFLSKSLLLQIFLFQQYEQKLQDNETVMREYQTKIREYEVKLDIVNKENEQLRNSRKKAMDMVREMEAKLSFSQGIV